MSDIQLESHTQSSTSSTTSLHVTITSQLGAVTFMDVLGWKGIWQRNQDAINILQKFVEELSEHAHTVTNNVCSGHNQYRGKNLDELTTVLSISDTIAIFTPEIEVEHALEIHAKICAFAIPTSIQRGIPVRGATAYGEYSSMKNIMVGAAVDEAASWHESTDWIGVHLTPSAWLKVDECNPPVGWTNYQAPFKKVHLNTACVVWEFPQKEESLRETFYAMGPMLPEIAPKYINTISYQKHLEAQGIIPVLSSIDVDHNLDEFSSEESSHTQDN